MIIYWSEENQAFSAEVPELSGCTAEGKAYREAFTNVEVVIKGWIEALQLMPTGSKWQIFIPSDLAYGERGSGTNIGPNATLIYEVELLSVQAKPEAKPEPKPEPKPNSSPNPD